MKVKTWVPLVLAVILGLIAAKLTRDSVARGRAPGPQVSMVPMVTAAQDIEPGQKLTADMLTIGKVAAGSVPAGAFESPADLADRVALSRFVKDQSVLESMLAPQGTAAGVQALIPPGMRAITVEVNEFSGLAGLFTPGSRVDIISVVRGGDEGASQQSMARTIVQNVEVRAVGRSITPTPPAAGADGVAAPLAASVTLLVTPAQAEALQLAGTGGRPWLVLRNPRDEAPFETAGTSLADLRGEARKAPLPEPEPQPQPETVAVVPPTDDVDVFEEKPSEPLPPPAPRTRAVTFIRATKEETVQVDLPEQPDTITSTNDPSDPAGGK